jgi:hypothetical protein
MGAYHLHVCMYVCMYELSYDCVYESSNACELGHVWGDQPYCRSEVRILVCACVCVCVCVLVYLI